MDVISIGLIFIYALFILLTFKRLMRYAHALKMCEYKNSRFRRWMVKEKVHDKFIFIVAIGSSFAWGHVPDFLLVFGVFFAVTLSIYFEKDPRVNPRDKVLETNRDKRIYYISFGLLALVATWPWWLFQPPHNTLAGPWAVYVYLIPFVFLRVNMVMMPIDNAILKVHRNEVRKKIGEYQPVVVGVTGSYDKAYVKYILSYILATRGTVLMTPDGVKTLGGLTEFLSETLEEKHKYLVVEMSALEPGYVTALCNLTLPEYAVVSSIGRAHYESYDSMDMLARSNFEIVYAVNQREEGRVIAHERTMRFSPARMVRAANRSCFMLCGDPAEKDRSKQVEINYMEPSDTTILSQTEKPKGFEIKISYKSRSYTLRPSTRDALVAQCCVVSAVAALEMGVDIDSIQRIISRLPRLPSVESEPKRVESEGS